MKSELLKGVVMRNLLYLVLFFVIYFPMVITGFFMKDTFCNAIESTGVFDTDCNDIPEATIMTLQFILYGLVPLGAIVWTIMSMSQPTYQPVYQG